MGRIGDHPDSNEPFVNYPGTTHVSPTLIKVPSAKHATDAARAISMQTYASGQAESMRLHIPDKTSIPNIPHIACAMDWTDYANEAPNRMKCDGERSFSFADDGLLGLIKPLSSSIYGVSAYIAISHQGSSRVAFISFGGEH